MPGIALIDVGSRRIASLSRIKKGPAVVLIVALLDRHRAVYLNDLLPANRTSSQYQAVSLIAAKLEDEGKIKTWSYLCRWGKPGNKVLVKPGHTFKHGDAALLKDNERLRLDAET